MFKIRGSYDLLAAACGLLNSRLAMLGLLTSIAAARLLWTALNVPLLRCGDEFGYIFYEFQNLNHALSGIRPPGLPILIDLYSRLFNDFSYWPEFQTACFLGAVIWLFIALVGFGVRPFTALCVTAPLAVMGPAFQFASFICSETMAMTFVVASCAFLIRLAGRPTFSSLMLFAGTTVFSILVKPGFLPIVFLLPVCAIILARKSGKWLDCVKAGVTVFAVIVVPLGIYVGARTMMTGHTGLTSFGQMLLAGHTTGYLTKSGMSAMGPEVKRLAQKILDRRERLAIERCRAGQDSSGDTGGWWQGVKREQLCFGSWYHTAFLAAVERLTGLLPNPDTGGTYVPWPPSGSSTANPPPSKPLTDDKDAWSWGGDRWLHETAFGQKGTTAVAVERLLSEYNSAILKQHFSNYANWLAGGSIYALKEFSLYLIRELLQLKAILFAGALAMVAILLRFNQSQRGVFIKETLKPIEHYEAVIVFLAFSLPIASLFLTVLLAYTYSRYVVAPSVLLPAVLGFLLARCAAGTMAALQGSNSGFADRLDGEGG